MKYLYKTNTNTELKSSKYKHWVKVSNRSSPEKYPQKRYEIFLSDKYKYKIEIRQIQTQTSKYQTEAH